MFKNLVLVYFGFSTVLANFALMTDTLIITLVNHPNFGYMLQPVSAPLSGRCSVNWRFLSGRPALLFHYGSHRFAIDRPYKKVAEVVEEEGVLSVGRFDLYS